MTTTTLPHGTPRSDPPINDEAVSNSSASNPPSISQLKLEANRRNAQLSTGPTSAEGKKTSSFNASKHGLLVKDVVITTRDNKENQAEFDGLLAEMRDFHAPVGIAEDLLLQELTISRSE